MKGKAKTSLVLGFIVVMVGAGVIHNIATPVKADPVEGLVGYWNFDEGSGTVVEDQSPYGNDGTIYGNAQRTQGVSGQGLLFDGEDDYVTIPDSASIRISGDITISAWVKTSSWDYTDPIVSKGLGDFTFGYFLGTGTCYPPYQASFQLRKTSVNGTELRSEETLTVGTWYHIVGTRSGTTAKIYINGVLDNTTACFSGAIRTNTEPLDFGAHYSYTALYQGVIDEIRIYNRALNYSEIQYLYENPGGVPENQPPNIPNTPTPVNSSTGVSTSVDLRWSGGDPDPGDTTTYSVYFGTTTSPPKRSTNQSSLVYDPGTLNYSTIYYWRIIAWDNHGATRQGPLWRFTTTAQSNQPPNVPNSPTPFNGSTGISLTSDLGWSGGDPNPGDVTTYSVYFGTTTNPLKRTTNQTGLVYDPGTLNYSTTYYWRIIAWDNHGATRQGPLWRFTTTAQSNQPPNIPNTPTPMNSSTGISITTDLSWSGGDPNPGDTTTYSVYFGTTTNPPKRTTNQTSLIYDPGTLPYNTTYYWKIISWDNHGASRNGPLWHFTTTTPSNQPPNIPNTPTPVNSSMGVSIAIDLRWSGGDPNPGDTITYSVYFGTTSSPPIRTTNQTNLIYDPGTLNYSTTYFWRVVAWDNHGVSRQGPLWRFTTIAQSNQPPNIPSSPTPMNSSTGISIRVDLGWSGGDPNPGDTTTYSVYFGTTSSPAKRTTNQTSLIYDLGTLNYSTTYYWKIIAWDNLGTARDGPVWHFTTASKPRGGGGGSGTQAPSSEPPNTKPVANTSAGEPYGGFINSEVLFDGSASIDPDGTITEWFWSFGDHTNGTGKTIPHLYNHTGIYPVTLTVTDNEGAQNTRTTTCVIVQPNRPPTKPLITGPVNGTTNTSYTIVVQSTDADNDTIQYIFHWGDRGTSTTSFMRNGTQVSQTHLWTRPGKYLIQITAFDNHTTSETNESMILIDVLPIHGFITGYLIDIDSDGTYDLFNNTDTGVITNVSKGAEGSYYIDSNGDGLWDVVFDTNKKTLQYPDEDTATYTTNVVIISVGGLALLGICYLGFTETGKYKFFLFLFSLGPLFTRIHRDEALHQEMRENIYEYIESNPGAHYNSIMKNLGIGNGSLAHHLNMLEKMNMVKSRREGIRYRAFYLSEQQFPDAEMHRFTDLQEKIVEKIKQQEGISQTTLISELGLTQQTVNYNIKKLERSGIIRLERKGGKTYCYYFEEVKKEK